MKRSRSIRLVLIGSLSAGAVSGALTGGTPAPAASVTTSDVFTNNFYVPGAGYYHAPFRAWYPLPYNHHDPQNNRYFFGGEWGGAPYESPINISAPTPDAVRKLSAQRTDIQRGGFGNTSRFSTVRT